MPNVPKKDAVYTFGNHASSDNYNKSSPITPNQRPSNG